MPYGGQINSSNIPLVETIDEVLGHLDVGGTLKTVRISLNDLIITANLSNFPFRAIGTYAERDDYDAAPALFTYLSTNGDAGVTTTRAVLFMKESDDDGDWSDPAFFEGETGPAGNQFDVPISVQGLPRPGEIFPRFIMSSEVNFAEDFAGSQVDAGNTSTSTAVISIKKNGVEVGTLTFSAGIAEGVFDMPGGETFEVGSILSMVWPNPRDTTLGNIAISLHGTR